MSEIGHYVVTANIWNGDMKKEIKLFVSKEFPPHLQKFG